MLPKFVSATFKYPISAWPVILTEKLTNELERVTIELPRLLKEVPELYFKNDPKRIADFFFDGDVQIAEFFLLCVQKKTPVSSRLDLTYTKDGFKVLEVNVGSSIGGMEFQNFESLMEDMHKELAGTNGVEYTARQTQNIYIKFIVDQIKATGNEINIFLLGKADTDKTWQEIERKFYNDLLDEELAGSHKQGAVFIDTKESLKFQNNALYYKGKEIHCVITPDANLTGMTPDLFRALLMDKVYFPDHLANICTGNKRSLALLRRLAHAEAFTAAENELILKNVPWTEIVEETDVIYKGISQPLLPLLAKNKDEFVVKLSDGMQGEDVYIGKFLSEEEWKNALETVVSGGKYVAQEFCDSVDLLAPDDANVWTPHKLVWGAFGFGDRYGGVWVRMSSLKNTSGAINSAKGAVEAIVYEAHPKAKAHVLMI